MCTIHKNAYYFNSMAHKSSVSFDTSTAVTCEFETNAQAMIQCIRHTIDMVIILLLWQYQYGLGLRIPHTSKEYNLSYLTFVFCSFWKWLMHVMWMPRDDLYTYIIILLCKWYTTVNVTTIGCAMQAGLQLRGPPKTKR